MMMRRIRLAAGSLVLAAALAVAGQALAGSDGAKCPYSKSGSDGAKDKGACCCCCQGQKTGLGGEQKNPYVSPSQQSGWWSDGAPAKDGKSAR